MSAAPVVVAVVKAFLTRVSFQAAGDSCGALAFLHLQDDADCHKFRVAVPAPFATEMAKRLADDTFGGYAEDPHLFVSFAPITGEGEKQPSLEQLLAVWHASAFVDDFAHDAHLCAICDGVLDGHDDHGDPNVRHCDVGRCPGGKLRSARKETA